MRCCNFQHSPGRPAPWLNGPPAEDTEPILLPAPTLEETSCHEEFTLSGLLANRPATIQASVAEAGPYNDIMITDGLTTSVTINNDFTPWDGSWWFRVDYGDMITAPVNPTGPNVKPPIIVVGNDVPIPVSLRGWDHLHFSSAAQISENNTLIQPDVLAVRITERYEYHDQPCSFHGYNTTNREESGTITFSSDGTDPRTAEPHTAPGISSYGAGNAFVIKARTKIGSCWSPLTLVVVDILWDLMCLGRQLSSAQYYSGSDQPCTIYTEDFIIAAIKSGLCSNLSLANWDSSLPFNSFSETHTVTPLLDINGNPTGNCSCSGYADVKVFADLVGSSNIAVPTKRPYIYGLVRIAADDEHMFTLDRDVPNLKPFAEGLIGAYTHVCGTVASADRVTRYSVLYTPLMALV